MSYANQEKYENWKKIIDEQQASGLSQKEFCLQKDLVLSQFVYYRAQLKIHTQNSSPKSPKFTPIKISDGESTLKSSEIKLLLPNGFQCSFPSHIEALQLRRLIEVLLSC